MKESRGASLPHGHHPPITANSSLSLVCVRFFTGKGASDEELPALEQALATTGERADHDFDIFMACLVTRSSFVRWCKVMLCTVISFVFHLVFKR